MQGMAAFQSNGGCGTESAEMARRGRGGEDRPAGRKIRISVFAEWEEVKKVYESRLSICGQRMPDPDSDRVVGILHPPVSDV